MSTLVAVIDIGSNSIKALVAQAGTEEHSLETVFHDSLEVRISKGISGNPPVLSSAGMNAGVAAVEALIKDCRACGKLASVQIAATSAVRSAVNGKDFMQAIHKRTGVVPVTLSGEEEADGIALGVRTDPSIHGKLNKFTVFDLGGGSLELIRFENEQVVERISLPLGSVRLTEKYFLHPEQPIPDDEAEKLVSFVRNSIQSAYFRITNPLIGCSGGLTTWRSIRAKQMGVSLEDSPAAFNAMDISNMSNEVIHKDLQHRIQAVMLPPGRADIFPAALLTLKVVLELSGSELIQHSLHNLRYGLAWKALHEASA